MSKMKTNEVYVTEVHSKYPEIIPLEEYQGNKTKILHKHITCGYEWKVTPKDILHGHSCPKCSGRLGKTSEEFENELYEKQGDNFKILTPYKKFNQKIKLQHKCGYIFETFPSSILSAKRGNGCPKCSNRHFYKPKGNLSDNYPDFCKLLVNKDDGNRYNRYTTEKLELKCPDCGHIQKRQPNTVISHGFRCEICRDGLSKNEKIMRSVLIQLNIDFEVEKIFDWSDNKRYDFYFDGIICETHGSQHYEEGFEISGNIRNLEEEISNDKYKKKMAFEHGFTDDTYVVIDCRKSDFEWVKDHILSSKLSEYYDLSIIDWVQCEKDSISSVAIHANDLWESGMSTPEIAKELKLSKTTISKYLGALSNIGVSSYDPNFSRISGTIRKVICLNNSQIFNSIIEASKLYNIDRTAISDCCLKGRKSAGKLNGERLVWAYYEDYENMSTEEIEKLLNYENPHNKKVICVNNKMIFDTITEATKYTGLKSLNSIASCCKGLSSSAGRDKNSGEKLKWMYYDNYLKSIAS